MIILYGIFMLAWYMMLYVAVFTLYFLYAVGYGIVWMVVRIWQTRPRAAAPRLGAAHLWSHRAARDELRRVRALPVMYAPPPARAPEDCVPYAGHVYYRPTIDKAWAAASRRPVPVAVKPAAALDHGGHVYSSDTIARVMAAGSRPGGAHAGQFGIDRWMANHALAKWEREEARRSAT